VSGARRELWVLTGALQRELERRERRGLRKESSSARTQPPGAPAPEPRASASSPRAQASAARAESAPPTRAEAQACGDLGELARKVAACRACGLCEARTQTVFMDGDPERVARGEARVMFVGEAPGAEEDRQGVPFVGPAGQLLTDIVEKGMGLARSEVVIANVLKCRPPDNRDPQAHEKELCTPWLDRQIELVDPEILIPLGRHASNHLLGLDATMGSLRGRVHLRGERKVVPTYHPAYLLRDPSQKRHTLADIQLAMREMGLAPPDRP